MQIVSYFYVESLRCFFVLAIEHVDHPLPYFAAAAHEFWQILWICQWANVCSNTGVRPTVIHRIAEFENSLRREKKRRITLKSPEKAFQGIYLCDQIYYSVRRPIAFTSWASFFYSEGISLGETLTHHTPKNQRSQAPTKYRISLGPVEKTLVTNNGFGSCRYGSRFH